MNQRFTNCIRSGCALIALFATGAMAETGNGAGGNTPAEISIRKAQQEIARTPGHYSYWNSLAMAYARRARETSDVSFYQKADDALKQSFKLSPANFEGLKVETWLLLGRHEFAKALESATRLNKENPDDATVYGYLVDANAELGNYAEAVEAAQWILNLKPGSIAGLTRAAYLRELHGQLSGAIEAMQMAYDATPFQETEDRAWILTQIAHLHVQAGNPAEAERYASGALDLFPKYHYALGTMAQIRLAQGRVDDAVALFQTRYAAAPHAENLYALASAFQRAGRGDEAAKAFSKFEQMALRESSLADNANHELIAYYVDVAHDPEKALPLAQTEIARRHDVFTLDAYAWALAASGQYARASAAIRKALAIGGKDPGVLYHAGVIARHENRNAEARELLQDAAARNHADAQRALQEWYPGQ
jgi:tetratricopeptide (TPR) repeat protein